LLPAADLDMLRAMKKKQESSPVAAFESALSELEQIVLRMEQGDLGLDESLRAYERGVGLYRSCQIALNEAEQRVRLLQDQDPEKAQAFDADLP
jgi:exodeoxyribonuclease VII small subunit